MCKYCCWRSSVASFMIRLELRAECQVAKASTIIVCWCHAQPAGAPICEMCLFDFFPPLALKITFFLKKTKAHKTHIQASFFQIIQFFKCHKDIRMKDECKLLHNADSPLITYINRSHTNCLHVKSRWDSPPFPPHAVYPEIQEALPVISSQRGVWDFIRPPAVPKSPIGLHRADGPVTHHSADNSSKGKRKKKPHETFERFSNVR